MKELRFIQAEVRADVSTDGRPYLEGWAARYNSTSKPIPTAKGSFRERIAPGAFARTLRNARQDVAATIEHDTGRIVGSTHAGNLELKCDNSNGLWHRCYPDMNVSYAADLYRNVKNHLIRSMSFAFQVPENGDDWDDDEDDETGERFALRTLNDVDLFDVSYVYAGAYEAASCHARSLFPDGIPATVETRSAGGRIVIPDTLSTEEILGELAKSRVF
jgi:HK97 family phage prohead protease